MRVGGETNAIELEDENFTLKRSLLETQQALVAHQEALREMDAKYSKAMLNLVKLDHAWKASAEDLKRAQQDVVDAKTEKGRLEQDVDALKQDHEAEIRTVESLAKYQEAQLADVRQEVAQQQQQLREQSDELEKLRLHNRELNGHIDALTKKNNGVQVASKQDYDELQREYQELKEQCASLRGETNALREESGLLKKQLEDAKATISVTTSRFLQLKEELATSQVHLASTKQTVAEHEDEAAFLKEEIERIQGELSKRDDNLLRLEKESARKDQELAQQRKVVEHAEQVYGNEAQRVAMAKEKEWKEREFELEKEIRARQEESLRAHEQLAQMQQRQNEVLLLFAGPGDDAERYIANHELKVRVKEEIQRAKTTASTLEKAQLKMEKMEKELARQGKLVQENEDLRAEHDKAKKAMERMALRKNKFEANRTPTKSEKRPSDEKAELWRSKVEPSRAKRKLEASQEEGSSSRRGSNCTATASAAAEEDEARKAKIKRVFVASRYMNNVTSRRMDF